MNFASTYVLFTMKIKRKDDLMSDLYNKHILLKYNFTVHEYLIELISIKFDIPS